MDHHLLGRRTAIPTKLSLHPLARRCQLLSDVRCRKGTPAGWEASLLVHTIFHAMLSLFPQSLLCVDIKD